MRRILRSIGAAVLFSHWVAGVSPLAVAGTFKHITIDGNFSDWAGVPVAYSDPSEEGANAGTDFKTVWIAHDSDYVFVRVGFYNTGSLLRSQNNVFINADGDSATGYGAHGTGSELLIQGGVGYQEKNGTFNDGNLIADLGWSAAPTGSAGEFEFRISRHAKYDDGTPVFTSETIAILLETENPNFGEVDIAKDDGPIEYTLTAAPPHASGTVQLVALTAANWQFNRSGTEPASEWREPGFDDSQGGWESGRALFGKTADPSVYPAPVVTPLTEKVTTFYLRAKFNWDKDSDGLSLVASNILSDGALVWLNGAEVARVRLAAGAISAATLASGVNPRPGSVEIIDVPASALVVGENILAVELHRQAADASELVFGLSLLASDALPVAILEPSAPRTLTVDEGAPATLAVTVRGTEPITYQWFKGNATIIGATNATFKIDQVTVQDAGDYTVKVGNAVIQNVVSPAITLTTRAIPVTLTDPKLPADLTVTAGETARFTVSLAGSEPIAVQWFKDGVALGSATNQVYEIPVALASDAGQYTVVVSNRVTAPLTSRTALLTVNTDRVPPTLLAVSGGGRRISLKFSEAVDAASVTPANFVITPSLAVSTAQLSADDGALVILETARAQLGTVYTVAVSNVKDRFANVIGSGSAKSFRATIQIDGDFSDWEGVEVVTSDPDDAGPETGAHADFKDVSIASDNDFVYLHFTLWRAGDPFIFYNNIFVDADNDVTTGYAFNGLGSELLIQGGGGYEQKAGVFNDGAVNDLDWLAFPEAPGTEFEVRFSRKAQYADADAGGSVFKSDTIALVLESENNGFQAKDTAPDNGSGVIVHTLKNYEVTELGPLSAVRTATGIRITWTGAAKLQATGSFSPVQWQDVPNASSPFDATPTPTQTFYRLVPR